MKKTLSIAVLSGLAITSLQVQAFEDIPHNENRAYVWDSYGSIVRDQFGGCVRTIEWTKETAIAKCEGWEEPKPVVAPVAIKSAAESLTTPAVQAVVAKPALVSVPEAVAVTTPEPAPEPEVVNKVVVEQPVAFTGFFATNGDELTARAKQELDAYAAYMQVRSTKRLTITGHTDNTGNAQYNQALSERRALTVKDYLVMQGIDAGRITTKGLGIHQPVADNNTSEGRAQNRRVELELID